MRISTKGSVAVHCLLYLHEHSADQNVTSEVLAQATGRNAVVIRNLLSALKKSNIVTSENGVGNTRLAQPPEDVSLYDVVRAIEPDFIEKLIGIHDVPSVPGDTLGENLPAALSISYGKVKDAMMESLEHITLADVLRDLGEVESGGSEAAEQAN